MRIIRSSLLGVAIVCLLQVGSLPSPALAEEQVLAPCKIIGSLAPGVLTPEMLMVSQDNVPEHQLPLLGVWEGYWGGQDPAGRTAPSVIVVQSISGVVAKVAYVFNGTFQRMATDWDVTPDGRLFWSFDTTAQNGAKVHIEFVLSVTPDDKLHGERSQTNNGSPAPGSPSLTDHERCQP